MTASEKLKALDTPLPANLGEWGDEVRRRGAIFLDALPLIVAVVEAAEDMVPGPYVSDEGPALVPMESVVAFYAALAALEEAP